MIKKESNKNNIGKNNIVSQALKAIKLWFHYRKMNILSAIEYRANFFLILFASSFEQIGQLLLLVILFNQINYINGWNFGEVLLISASATIVISITLIIIAGINSIAYEIRTGGLDILLARPKSLYLQLVGSQLWLVDVGTLIGGIIKFIIAIAYISISLSLIDIVLYFIALISGIVILIALTTITMSITFFSTKVRNFFFVLYRSLGIGEYPLEIYGSGIVFLLTFILPLGFVSYYPAQAILHKGTYSQFTLFAPIIAIVFSIIASYIWSKGVRRYTSTGS
jgi:ABC-2 type transport system permease protein